MSAAPALLAHGLCVGYGAGDVVHEVDVQLPAGVCVALIGANGAGKTTLLCGLSGLRPVDRGQVRLFGERIDAWPTHRRLRAGLSHCPEGRRVFAHMSVLDNLRLGAHVVPDASTREELLAAAFARFPKLYERRRQLAGTLSGGEQQMLALARALMAKPRVLLLDEPSLGLAPKMVAEVFGHIAALTQEGLAVLLVEQNAAMALQVAQSAYVLEHGRIALQGRSAELQNDARVQQIYLGA